jgi:hypothetical protein
MPHAETPDTIRKVVRSWMTMEVLAPRITKDGWSGFAAEKGGRQRNKASATANCAAYWASPGDDDETPWPLLPEHPDHEDQPDDPDRPRRWFYVVLGAIPAALAFERVDAAFSDDADEDETHRKFGGNVIAATVVLNEWGVLVADTLAVASFALGSGPHPEWRPCSRTGDVE